MKIEAEDAESVAAAKMASAARSKALIGYAVGNLLPDYKIRQDLVAPRPFFVSKSSKGKAVSGKEKVTSKKSFKGARTAPSGGKDHRDDAIDVDGEEGVEDGEAEEDYREEPETWNDDEDDNGYSDEYVPDEDDEDASGDDDDEDASGDEDNDLDTDSVDHKESAKAKRERLKAEAQKQREAEANDPTKIRFEFGHWNDRALDEAKARTLSESFELGLRRVDQETMIEIVVRPTDITPSGLEHLRAVDQKELFSQGNMDTLPKLADVLHESVRTVRPVGGQHRRRALQLLLAKFERDKIGRAHV